MDIPICSNQHTRFVSLFLSYLVMDEQRQHTGPGEGMGGLPSWILIFAAVIHSSSAVFKNNCMDLIQYIETVWPQDNSKMLTFSE